MDLNNVTQTLRLREYYYMVLRHKVVFIVAALSMAIIATGFAMTRTKIYRAETVLLVEDEQILNPLIAGLAISPSVYARMRTMREELLSWQRLTLLIEKLDLAKKDITPIEFEKLIKVLRDNINIKFRGSELITVSFEGDDPKEAQAIVQTLADIIVEGNLTSANLEANSAIQFLEEQLTVYRKKLESSEANLREFQELYNSTLPLATRMNEQLIALKMELSNLMVDNTEEHPRVIQTKQLIDRLESQRDDQFQKARESGFDIAPEEYGKLVSSLPRQEQYLTKLRRDYDVDERMYSSLLQRLETAKISQTLEKSDKGTKFMVLEPARLPLVPVKPNKPLIIIAGVMLGMGLGLVLIFLIELSNNSIRNLDEARLLLEMPIFGAIATIHPDELIAGERFKEELRVSV